MRRIGGILITMLAACVSACDKQELVPDTPVLLLQSVVSADRADERQHIVTKFTYDESGLLIERQRNDTTRSKLSDTFIASQRKINYTYNTEGLLIKSSEEVISLTDFGIVEANYSYKNGQLVAEKIGGTTTKYTYDSAGELAKVETTYSSGFTQEVSYSKNVPLVYQVENDGYSYLRGNVKNYYNDKLQLVKREQTKGSEIVLLEERTYASGKSYYNALPEFKGFPYVKSEAYGGGIRNTKLLYDTEGGKRVLIEEEKFTQTFDSNGFLIKNEGVDRFRLNTSAPEVNYLTYEYTYSR